jgi:hypothetical protein
MAFGMQEARLKQQKDFVWRDRTQPHKIRKILKFWFSHPSNPLQVSRGLLLVN